MKKKYFKYVLNANQKKELVDKYIAGESISKLSSSFKIKNLRMIRRIIKQNNVRLRSLSESMKGLQNSKKHYFDDKFFDVIDRESKAYILGLFFSDGWRVKNGFGFSFVDKELVFLIKKELNATHKIYKKPKKKSHHSQQYEIFISSRIVSKKLKNIIGGKSKTFDAKFPKIKLNLISHFVRGLFDGDGSVSVRNGKHLYVSLISTKYILKFIVNYLKKDIGGKVPICNHGKTYRIFFSCKKAIKFRNFIYKNSKFYLKRKRDKFYIV